MRSKKDLQDAVLVNCCLYDSIPDIPGKVWFFYAQHGVKPNNPNWLPVYTNEQVARACGIQGVDAEDRSDKVTKARAALLATQGRTGGTKKPRLVRYTKGDIYSYGVPMDAPEQAQETVRALNDAYTYTKDKSGVRFTAQYAEQFSDQKQEMPALWDLWLGMSPFDLPGMEVLEGKDSSRVWSRVYNMLGNKNKFMHELKVPKDLRLNVFMEVVIHRTSQMLDADGNIKAIHTPQAYLTHVAEELCIRHFDTDVEIAHRTVRLLNTHTLSSVCGQHARVPTKDKSKPAPKVAKVGRFNS